MAHCIVPVAVAVIASLKAYGTWTAPPAANILISIYGVFHLGLAVIILGSKGNLGIGSILTLVCFICLLILAAKPMPTPEPSGAKEHQGQSKLSND